VRDRARELEELQEAVTRHSGGREEQPELEAEQRALQRDFQQLLTPLARRRGQLEASRAVHQFYRDLADELVGHFGLLHFLYLHYRQKSVVTRTIWCFP